MQTGGHLSYSQHAAILFSAHCYSTSSILPAPSVHGPAEHEQCRQCQQCHAAVAKLIAVTV